MKNLRAFILCFFPIVLGLLAAEGCKKEPPVVPEPTLSLTAVDASCTEAWLKPTTTQLPATVRLLRDGQRVSDLRLLTSDSLVIDEGLLPNRAYTYQLQRLNDNSTVIETSASAQVTTMDTTSHAWLFDPPVLLGDGSSSVLYDVAIINDTLVYAVGEIYKRDSLGNWDPNAYNLVKWNGREWQLMRIQFYTFCGQSGTGSYPTKSIFAFSPTDIWIGMDGSQVVRWNGGSQSAPTCTPVSINKLWGNSSTGELYAVGNGGGIAIRSPSGTWRRLESGTTGNLVDVWGFTNPLNGNAVVFAVGGTSNDVRLLSLSPAGARDTLSWYSTLSIGSVWTVNRFRTYVSGVGIWRYRHPSWHQMEGVPPSVSVRRIRGSTDNNIVAVGWHGRLAHFNGVSWRMATEIPSSYYFESVAVSQDMVVAVGYTVSGFFSDRALIIMGRR
ncbi:MAG: glucosyl transferase [Bacteroidetes bacterium]|nr:glucosyl transferase [Bacteroidota bacterium]MCW5894888.1 glucosyl transferase [Bacteroidota bacterium]